MCIVVRHSFITLLPITSPRSFFTRLVSVSLCLGLLGSVSSHCLSLARSLLCVIVFRSVALIRIFLVPNPTHRALFITDLPTLTNINQSQPSSSILLIITNSAACLLIITNHTSCPYTVRFERMITNERSTKPTIDTALYQET
jgi:hypothetical protein